MSALRGMALGAFVLCGCGGAAHLSMPPVQDGPSLEAQELAAMATPPASPPTRAQVLAHADAGVGALLAEVEAEPVWRSGKFFGFRLRGVAGAATLARVGLLDGDVLLRVGEQAIVTPDDAHAALEASREAEALVFEVERDGERIEVSTPIVGAPRAPGAPVRGEVPSSSQGTGRRTAR